MLSFVEFETKLYKRERERDIPACMFTKTGIVNAQLFVDKFICRVRVEDGIDSFIIA